MSQKGAPDTHREICLTSAHSCSCSVEYKFAFEVGHQPGSQFDANLSAVNLMRELFGKLYFFALALQMKFH
ncbi:hypothetical protein T08_6498 [Trichinella sp. T8]|nr:hypothetical protein T08_6498 [Trichinella sp. T8]